MYLLAHPEEAIATGHTDADDRPILDVLLQAVHGLSLARQGLHSVPVVSVARFE